MVKFLGKCVIFVVLLSLFQVGLGYFLESQRSFHWGHEYLHARMDHLENQAPYNIMALGSSRVMCHLNPNLLNSLLIDTYPSRSFNCGLAGTFAPITYNFYEKYLDSDLPKASYVLLELDWLMQPTAPDIHVTDYKYWYSFKEYLFALSATWKQPKIRKVNKLVSMYGYSVSYLEKLWNVGLVKSWYEVERDGPNKELLGLEGNGFINLEDAVVLASDPEIREGMAALRDGFFADTTVLSSARSQATSIYNTFDPAHPINPAHWARVQNLLERSQEKGVHLIFLLSPRVYAPDLLAMMEKLPQAHKINLSDPRKYPEFYVAKFSFDDMHLNHAGATLYTESLAAELKNIIPVQNTRVSQQ